MSSKTSASISKSHSRASGFLLKLARERRSEGQRGIYSVCSAHPWVLEAAMRRHRSMPGPVLIEATIMSLEEVLRITENDSGEVRNPENYYFSVFGTPPNTRTWGYRVEGHHLSQNYTVVNGEVVDGPSFFGANPAQIHEGPRKGLRILAGEDDLGFDLIHALDEHQQKVAIVAPIAYPEILTGASRKAALQGQPSGLPASGMNARQFDALMALIEEYARNVPDELAEKRIAEINKAGRNIYFVWSGGIGRSDPHYYRVQTASFLIELDDTQDDANHIHSVWREVSGDFGQGLLKQHYETNHHSQ